MKRLVLAILFGDIVIITLVLLLALERPSSQYNSLEQKIERIQGLESNIVFSPVLGKKEAWNEEKVGFVQLILEAAQGYLLPKDERPVLEEIFLPADSFAPQWWQEDDFSQKAILIVGRSGIKGEREYPFYLIVPVADDFSPASKKWGERMATSLLSVDRPY